MTLRERGLWRGRRKREAEFSGAAGGGVVGEGDGAAVGGGDLLREHKSNAAPFRLSGVEGDEEVRGIEQAGAGVDDLEDGLGRRLAPGDEDARWRGGLGEGGFDGVADEVDEELLELVRVGEEEGFRTGFQGDGDAGFEGNDRSDESSERGWFERRGGQAGELLVSLEEAVERGGAIFDDGEAAVQVFGVVNAGAKAAGDGFDRGKRSC